MTGTDALEVLEVHAPLLAVDRADLLAAASAAIAHHFPLDAAKARTDLTPLDRQGWTALCADLDPAGLALPVAVGGDGLSFAHLVVAAQAAGALVAPIPLGVVAAVVAPVLAEVAPELLPDVLSGWEIATCLDTGTGSAPWGGDADVAYRIMRRGDEWLVSRVPAAAATVTPHRGVDRTRPHATWIVDAQQVEELGVLSVPTWELIRAKARAVAASEAVGTARASLDRAVSYVAVREQFGRPVGSFQAVQQRAADLFGEVESAAAAVDHAALVIDRGDVRQAHRSSLVALVRAVEAAQVVARESLHLHGGIGFTWEHDAHLFLKRSLADAQVHGGRPDLLLELADLLGDS